MVLLLFSAALRLFTGHPEVAQDEYIYLIDIPVGRALSIKLIYSQAGIWSAVLPK